MTTKKKSEAMKLAEAANPGWTAISEVVCKHPTNPNVSVRVFPHKVAVLINGLPHLILRRTDLTGIQSYIKDVGVRFPVYFIEFSMRKGRDIIADYDKRPLWEAIICELMTADVFDNMQGAGPLPGSA